MRHVGAQAQSNPLNGAGSMVETAPSTSIDAPRTVELFAGIGGFRMAADRSGLRTIWANDISTAACRVYRDRFGSGELHAGDVRTVEVDIPDHDVLTGGFPCQPFSSAGKKRGIEDPRGTLFHAIVQILRQRRPRFFVLENVKRLLSMQQGAHFATILEALAALDYQIEWRLLTAMHFGLAQNRYRVVIVGSRLEGNTGTRICLAREGDVNCLRFEDQEKVSDRRAWSDIGSHGERFSNWGLAQEGHFVAADLPLFSEAMPVKLLHEVLEEEVDSSFDFTESTRSRLTESATVDRFVDGVEILSNQKGGARMGYTVFGTRGVAPTLTSTTSRHYERYKIADRYRRLTNVEYARLQGFPDDHCRAVCIYDQYALYGNAVPPPMIEWVLRAVTARPATRVERPQSLFAGLR